MTCTVGSTRGGIGAVSWRGRCLAAQLAGGEGAAVSHASAAVLHGLIPARPTIDVISPKRRNDDDTLRIHCVELHDGETAHMDGVRVTTIARTLFDLCDRRLIAEAVARGLTTLEALEDFAERKRGARGAVQFAEAIGLPQYRSRFERCFHRWLRRRGFPEPELNLKVGRHTYDFVWCPHGVIVETDGPHHRTPAQRAVDEQVDREAAAHGYRVVRVAEEGFAARRDRVAALIWTALAAV